jgi:uncharacterized oxidoreductase
VLELIPPYVATQILPGGPSDPRAMPLAEYIAEVTEILKTQPDVKEICVERAKGLYGAAASGHYDEVFNGLNAAVTAENL